jgi:hypothetical protein
MPALSNNRNRVADRAWPATNAAHNSDKARALMDVALRAMAKSRTRRCRPRAGSIPFTSGPVTTQSQQTPR